MPTAHSLCPPRIAHRAQSLTYDDLAEGFSYDPASQVTAIRHQLSAIGSQINKAEYGYNAVGNRTSLLDRRGSQAFGYDQLDRLTSASHPLLAQPQAFAYDPVGNRTTGGSVLNAGNQLTADANHSYQYDDNGNLTRKTLLATGNYTQFMYDAENRLVKVEDFVVGASTPAATSTYRYDGLGRRIEKVANGQTKRYVYDGEDILLEYDGANVLRARYTHGPGIDEPIAVTKGGATFFYHQDGLGTVTDLTDSTGATAKSYSYDAYGNILESPGTIEQPYTYTGREFDSESGLYYYRARAYDAGAGRFLQKDPIGINGGDLNLYVYAASNPLDAIDPTGLEIILLPGKCGSSLPNLAVMQKLQCMDKCNGSANIFVTSGWRTSAQNRCAGGSKGSYHLSGQAADISMPGSSSVQTAALASACGFTGIGTYSPPKSNHTHVDVRPEITHMHNGAPLQVEPDWREKEPRCPCAEQ